MSKYRHCSVCLHIGGYCGSCCGSMFEKWGKDKEVRVTLHDLKDDTFFEKDVVIPANRDAGFFLNQFSEGSIVVDSWVLK